MVDELVLSQSDQQHIHHSTGQTAHTGVLQFPFSPRSWFEETRAAGLPEGVCNAILRNSC